MGLAFFYQAAFVASTYIVVVRRSHILLGGSSEARHSQFGLIPLTRDWIWSGGELRGEHSRPIPFFLRQLKSRKHGAIRTSRQSSLPGRNRLRGTWDVGRRERGAGES
jgi:hypothetical protein